ncbi:MAG: sugar porter family MFS transporter [Puia sp.]
MISAIPEPQQAVFLKTNYRRRYVYFIAGVASLGGLLFGFDLVIISGTIPFFSKYFALQEAGVGWAVGCINLGSALGALMAGKLSDGLGRKKSLLLCAFLFMLTGLGTGWATRIGVFIFFRILSGVAVGAAALVCPMYIAEMAPAEFRGRLVTFYQLAIVSGILLAYLSDYLLLHSGVNNWRWMFSTQSFPALLFFCGLFTVDESPRWLIRKNRIAEATQLLTRLGGADYSAMQVGIIQQSFSKEVKEHWRNLFQKKYRKVLFIGIAIAVFSQAVGQNSLFSYAPVIFKQAGLSGDTVFFQSVILGIVNFIFTFIAIGTVDKSGRRKLLLYGSVFLFADALILSSSFAFQWSPVFIIACIVAFIAIYAATIGPVTWVALSEIFPNKIRGSMLAVATLSLWVSNFITTASFPLMKLYFGLSVTFGIHAAICLVYFLFIWIRMPETKGRRLEDIEKDLVTG